jgi:magnesium-transporting ATPase (P-type)
MVRLKINPWIEVWYNPRTTIKSVLKYNPKYMVLPMAGLLGIALLSLLFESKDELIGGSSFIGSSFVAAIIGIGALFILSYLFGMTGKWMGGRSNSEKFRSAMVWSGVPIITSLILFIPLFFSLNSDLLGITSLTMLIKWVLILWSVYLLVSMISELENFSMLRSVFHIILVGILIAIPILFVKILIGTSLIL